MNESSREAGRETISLWIVHGTFNAPEEEGPPKWYQFDPENSQNFCNRLQACLRDGPLDGALWRPDHMGEEDIFSWSGDNDHNERLKAGKKLCDRIVAVTSGDPTARVHLVAHSHGGNIVLKAIELYQHHLRGQGSRIFRRLQKAIDRGDQAEAAVANTLRQEFPEISGPLPQAWLDLLAEFYQRGLEKRPAHSRVYRQLQPDHTRMLCFQKFWADWSEANRLGRVVFLGTPFYRKQWLASPRAFVRIIFWILRMSPTLPFHALLPYFSILVWGWILAITPWVTGPSWNPFEWPTWLVLLWFGVSIGALAADWTHGKKRNENVYFSSQDFYQSLLERRANRSTVGQVQEANKVEALVVTAKYLDEALIGLSAEPLLYATLIPQVRSLLYARPTPIRGGDSGTVGSGGGFSTIYWVPIRFIGRVLTNAAYVIVLPFWSPLRSFVLEPLLREIVVRIVCSAAYGIPADQLRGARIWVRDSLDLPEVFDELYWDISGAVLQDNSGDGRKQDSSQASVDKVSGRYSHINNLDELRRKVQIRKSLASEDAQASSGWQKFWSALPSLYRRYESGFALEDNMGPDGHSPKLEREEFSEELARIWFTAEERIKESIGAIELTHSLYYSNNEVIRAIARFLETGAGPDGALRRDSTSGRAPRPGV
ncbi:MAG: hypothetical protein IH838_05645 [Proteobacteria bacterium]|nr:hypothetical protein [Pseudomonadota bacterium]